MGKAPDTQKSAEAQRLARIESLVRGFCGVHLDDEHETYCLKLFGTLCRKRKIDIRRGKEEIWAASIIYVIARLNFLFDKDNENSITADMVCNFFDAKKSTIGNKATQIEKAARETGTSQQTAPFLQIIRDPDSSDELRNEMAERMIEDIYKLRRMKG